LYFLDTTFIVGLLVSTDQWNEPAVEIYNQIKNEELVISKLVIAETITILKNKLSTKDIREIYRNLPNMFKIIEDTDFFDEAMEIFIKYDSEISFFDSMYIFLMKNENILKLVSFDHDFDRIDGIIRIH
jgi:predicted nucleic acid-binding protein